MTSILFFLAVAFCFALELNAIFNPVKEFDISLRTREALEAGTNYKDMDKKVQSHYLNQVVYWLTAMLGIFSSQWPIFLLILILSFASRTYRNYIIGKWLDSAICGSLLLFAILNKFHLHHDIGGMVITALGL
jgi:hypothetical protein